MAKLTLPAPLFALLPEQERQATRSPRSVALAAASWQELVDESRTRFPLLATHLFSDSGTMRAGFVLVLNDEIVPRGTPVSLHANDEICIIPALAGG
jgi:molybdopterin converting factor small subunit